jgi:arylsulfatase A-like enzyme
MKSSKNKSFTRRQFIKLSGAAAISSVVPIMGNTPKKIISKQLGKKKRPNLLFVFSDQQSRDMVGCYGNEDLITPNIDRFASEGIKFEQSISSCPLCTAYRGMLMSGQHSLYNGAVFNDVPLLADNGRYFGHVLRDAGYKTGYIGKWHLLGGDRDRPIPPGKMRYGFDGTFLSNNCTTNFNNPDECFYWNDKGEKVIFHDWEVFGQTNQALTFLDQFSSESEEPFALFVSWHPPHDWGIHLDSLVYQYDTSPELMNLYDPKKIRLRPNVKDFPAIRRAYQGYYGMISGVDKAFGWLMEKLRQKGLEENTLVVFTSDHGDNLHSHDLAICKRTPYDTSIRTPLIMRFPNHLQRNKSTELIINPMDMMPTAIGLLGLDIPASVQGQDLSSAILKGKEDTVKSAPLYFFNPAWRGVYTLEYTYAVGKFSQHAIAKNGSLIMKEYPINVLFDRRNDPYQMRNLYDDKNSSSLKKEMAKLTKEWMDKFDDPGIEVSWGELTGLYGYPDPGLMDLFEDRPEEIEKLYQYPNGHFPQYTKEPGFKGRPIDVLKKHYSKLN